MPSNDSKAIQFSETAERRSLEHATKSKKPDSWRDSNVINEFRKRRMPTKRTAIAAFPISRCFCRRGPTRTPRIISDCFLSRFNRKKAKDELICQTSQLFPRVTRNNYMTDCHSRTDLQTKQCLFTKHAPLYPPKAR